MPAKRTQIKGRRILSPPPFSAPAASFIVPLNFSMYPCLSHHEHLNVCTFLHPYRVRIYSMCGCDSERTVCRWAVICRYTVWVCAYTVKQTPQVIFSLKSLALLKTTKKNTPSVVRLFQYISNTTCFNNVPQMWASILKTREN